MVIVLATLETRNFSFMAAGRTSTEAWDVMKAAWDEHRKRTGASWTWADIRDTVDIRDVRIGAAYRDGEMIIDTTGGK